MLVFTPFPLAAAEEAKIVDNAFTFLTVLAVPVFFFVVSVQIVSIVRYRVVGRPTQDGPPIRSNTGVVATWFIITTLLTVAVIIHPGATGIIEIAAMADEPVDLVVEATGSRWQWQITYPEHDVTMFSFQEGTELVLPIHQHVKFDITAVESDVLHAFWITGLRVKIDAVPGLVTNVYATPDKLASFDDDPGMRLQCAEMCGLGHADMMMPVRVVTEEEFEAWIAERKAGA